MTISNGSAGKGDHDNPIRDLILTNPPPISPLKRKELDVQIRWLIRRDMQEVLKIESSSFDFPWVDDDFLCCLRQRNCIGMVAEHEHQVIGFMIYELYKSRIEILNFAVAPQIRRNGVGHKMILRMIDKLHQQRRSMISLYVRERNLPAQLFFRREGFRAESVIRNHYEETAEDAFLMVFHLPEDQYEMCLPFYFNRLQYLKSHDDSEDRAA